MTCRTQKRKQLSVSEAKSKLTELVRRAEAGEDVVLTRHGHPAVRLVPVNSVPDGQSRKAILEAARTSGEAKAKAGPPAARSQDFLYRDDGLPR
jgi:prevent-host-death family protein